MTYKLLIISLVFLVSGCASVHEAWYVDQEFGQATAQTWSQQIAFPEKTTASTPAGIEGITAEEIMNVHNKTFAEIPQEINVISFGSLNGD